MLLEDEDVAKQKERVRQAYNKIAEEYDERVPGVTPLDVRFAETEMAFVLNRILETDEVLDLACGTGRFTIPIARKAKRVVGLDFSAAMIQKGFEKVMKEGLSNKIEFSQGDMESLPFSDHSFDVVTCMLALMHIPISSRIRVFMEVSRVLKPRGRMIVSVKNSIFERFSHANRFASVDRIDVQSKTLTFTKTKFDEELTVRWNSFSPQELDALFHVVGLKMTCLRGNIPLLVWLSDSLLEDPKFLNTMASIEELIADIPPFNHLGYYLLAEAIKPLRSS